MPAIPEPLAIEGPSGPIPFLASGDPRTCKAGVILGYGLNGRMEVQWPEAERLADSGYAVIVPEAPHHGLRADPFLDQMSKLPESDARARFLDLLETWVVEIPSLLDDLAARGATRFVVAGVSMGGHWALAAPSLDSRVEAVVSLLGDPEWDNRSWSPHLSLGSWANTSLLAITTDEDVVVPPQPMRTFVDLLNSRFPAKNQHVSVNYPGGHWMAADDWNNAWSRVITWLDDLR